MGQWHAADNNAVTHPTTRGRKVVCVFRYKEEVRRAAISATRWIGTNAQ